MPRCLSAATNNPAGGASSARQQCTVTSRASRCASTTRAECPGRQRKKSSGEFRMNPTARLKRSWFPGTGFALAALCLAHPGIAPAQEAQAPAAEDSGALQEVVVTAQK